MDTIDTGGGLSKPDPPKPEVLRRGRKLPENMERGLHERDRVGVQDFVLLEDFRSESAFIGNLRKRFKEDLIYVSRNFIYLYNYFSLFYKEVFLCKNISQF